MHYMIIPVISTAHMPYSSVLLDLKSDTRVCVAHYPEGGFLFVADLEGNLRLLALYLAASWLLAADRKSTRLNSSHSSPSRMPSSA